MNEKKTLKNIIFLDPLAFRKQRKITIGVVTSQCSKFKNKEKYDFLIFKTGKMVNCQQQCPPPSPLL
jgi:starvation-inducible outer membrane lipoprotein